MAELYRQVGRKVASQNQEKYSCRPTYMMSYSKTLGKSHQPGFQFSRHARLIVTVDPLRTCDLSSPSTQPTAQKFTKLISMTTKINLIKKLMDPPPPPRTIFVLKTSLVGKRNNGKSCTNSEGTWTNVLCIAVKIIGNYIRNKALAGCARLAAKLYKFSGLFG